VRKGGHGKSSRVMGLLELRKGRLKKTPKELAAAEDQGHPAKGLKEREAAFQKRASEVDEGSYQGKGSTEKTPRRRAIDAPQQ